MLRLRNGFFVVATAFFASSLSYSVFAEEIVENVEGIKKNAFVSEEKVEEVKKTPKVYFEDLKENLVFNGDVKFCFSPSGIPSSNIAWNGNEFRPFFFRLSNDKVKEIVPGFNAGTKASFNLIKIFKNNAGENVLKIFGGLEADLFSNDDFEDKAKNHFKISSLKGVLYDHFKFGYDSEFVTGAKTMVLFGGMFKINEVFSLDFDIFKNLPLIDLNISNDWKSSSDKLIPVANNEKNCVGKKVKEWKQSFFSINCPGFGLRGNFNCGDLGKCSLGFMGLPIFLTEKLAKNDSIYDCFGFGVKFNTDFQFLKGIDSFKVGVIFGRGIGDYVTKVKKSAELIKRSHNDLAGVPASVFLINEGKTVKSLELANFLDLSLFYAFKINPVHKVVCSVANLHFLNDYTEGKFLDKSGKNHYVNNILTLGLGYVFSVCKKMDFFANLNGVVFNVKNKDEKTTDLKDVDKKWGWGIDFGADFKI